MADSSQSILWTAIQSLVLPNTQEENHTNPAGEPAGRIPRNRQLLAQGRSRHEYPEVALPVYGTPCMEMDGKWYRLLPSRFAVITPGVEHVEGCASAKEQYILLWLIFSKRTMIAFACQHIPRKGWRTFMNRSLASPRVNLLRNLIQHGGQDFTDRRTETIRANIVAVLSELYAKEISKEKGSTPYPRSDKYADVLDSLHDFIETHHSDQLSISYLARMAGMSTCYLNRLFKRKFGISVQEHIIATRMIAAKEMLKPGNFMIKQVAAQCGYDDPLYFSKAFRKYYGYSPTSTQATQEGPNQ